MAEALESRTFLSAWATVDTWQMIPGSTGQCLAAGMASDKAGNVYAAGVAADSNGIPHGIIREETNGVWSTVADVANAGFNAVTTDSAGDVFASGCKNPSTSGGQPPSFTSSSNWIVAERAAGKASFSVVNDPVSTANNATAYGIAADQTGNVFVVGTAEETQKQGPIKTFTHWIVRKETIAQLLVGQDAFKTVDDYALSSASNRAYGVTNIASGPAAGLYVVGRGNYDWIVRRSTNGGSTWATIDDVTASGSAWAAYGVAGDASGNIYVVGRGLGESWLVRKSSNGGTSWSTVDSYGTSATSDAYAVGADAAGNVYVAGRAYDSTYTPHAVIRELPARGSTWSTVDDVYNNRYNAFTVDSFGNAYAGGSSQSFLVRSLPAAPMNLAAAAVSSSQINLSWTNAAGGNQSGFAIYRSIDDANFSLVNTVSSGVTSYNDSGLTAGTTYYYYVVTLLNLDGSSNPSNISSAVTAA
jgi:hypothetical protein